MNDTIGLFWLGNMGDAVASRLAAYGPVIGYDPDPARAAAAAERHGIQAAGDPAEVAAAGIEYVGPQYASNDPCQST